MNRWQLPTILVFLILVLFLLTYILSSPTLVCKDSEDQ